MSNQSRNTSSFVDFIRYGDATTLNDLANTKFTDVVFADGTQLKDVTFSELTTLVWGNLSKNISTFTNSSRN